MLFVEQFPCRPTFGNMTYFSTLLPSLFLTPDVIKNFWRH